MLFGNEAGFNAVLHILLFFGVAVLPINFLKPSSKMYLLSLLA